MYTAITATIMCTFVATPTSTISVYYCSMRLNLNQIRGDRQTVELRFSWECVLSHTWISPWTQKRILLCRLDPRKRSVTYVVMDEETSV